jgi:hypothetical protein
MAYIGQSGRPITTKHTEHTRYIKTNNPNSAYAMHILNNKHEYGTTNKTLKLLKQCNKGLKMNCWASFLHPNIEPTQQTKHRTVDRRLQPTLRTGLLSTRPPAHSMT